MLRRWEYKATLNTNILINITALNLSYIDDSVGATSSTREELNQFITAVNLFHPALKYTWEISNTSLALLDIKVSVEGNGLCTSVHYKPTDSHSYLLYSSSHSSHVKNSIPYSQFLRLRRLCSEDSDFSFKSEEMCNFFDKRGYPASVVQAGHHRAQQIDRQSALQTSQKENNNRIPFTLTFHPHNHAVKSVILKNFKLLHNDPDTGRIFSQPPLISFKRDKNIGNFLVSSHSRPQSLRSFWPVVGIESSGLVQHRKSVYHGLPVKSSKFDWLTMRNEYSAHAQNIGSGQSSRSQPQAKRIVGSGDENQICWI